MKICGEGTGGMFLVEADADDRIYLLTAVLEQGLRGLVDGEDADLDQAFSLTRRLGGEGDDGLWPRRVLELLRETADAEAVEPLLDATLHAGVMAVRTQIHDALTAFPIDC